MAKKVGRPKKTLTDEQIDYINNLCEIMCTQEEIASFFKMDIDTIKRIVKEKTGEEFSEFYKKGIEGGKRSLRRILFKNAKTHPATAIFLSKQLLGYSEKYNNDNETMDKIKIDED